MANLDFYFIRATLYIGSINAANRVMLVLPYPLDISYFPIAWGTTGNDIIRIAVSDKKFKIVSSAGNKEIMVYALTGF